MASIKQRFLSASTFAVVGASKDEQKYGTRVWLPTPEFLGQELIITPGTQMVQGSQYKCYTNTPCNSTPVLVDQSF